MNAYGNSVRAICAVTAYSRDKVQAALKCSRHQIIPKQKYYNTLQVDGFHTFVGNRKNKVWLICAYHAKTSEIVALIGTLL